MDFVRASATRLDLLEVGFPVVLGGGILRADQGALVDTVRIQIAALAPAARVQLVRDDPVVGAALLAMEAVGAPFEARDRVRTQLRRPGP